MPINRPGLQLIPYLIFRAVPEVMHSSYLRSLEMFSLKITQTMGFKVLDKIKNFSSHWFRQSAGSLTDLFGSIHDVPCSWILDGGVPRN